MNLAKLAVVITFLIGVVAEAKLYVAPIAGYQQGNLDYKYLASQHGGAADTGTNSGIGYGLALGWLFPNNLTLGAEAIISNLNSKWNGSTTPAKYNQVSSFVTVGYYAKPKFLVYLGGGTFSSTDDQSSQNTLTGYNIKVGLNYEFKDHLAFGADYVAYSTNQFAVAGGATSNTTDLYDHYTYTATILEFRFPFEI